MRNTPQDSATSSSDSTSAAKTSPLPNIGFFGLPVEIRAQIIAKHFNLHGPAFEIIDQRGTPDETRAIAPNTYRLIIDSNTEGQTVYSLGFSKKSASGATEYAIEPLDKKSAFYRVIAQDSDFISNIQRNPTLDRFAFYCLEKAIGAAGGTVKHRLQDRIQLAAFYEKKGIEREAKAWETNSPDYTISFDKAIKEALFQDFLFYVALGEQERAESILKYFPEFMLSKYKDGVLSVLEDFKFHKTTTAFKLAVRNGDWHMYNMMLERIPEDQREVFKTDLQRQLQDLKKNGLSYTLDNLSVCGLRVLEARGNEPTRKQTQAARAGDAYHLILYRDAQDRITSAELGFRDSAGKYARHPLPAGELQNFVLHPDNASFLRRKQGCRYLIVWDKKVLRLAEKEINQLGGKTKIEGSKTGEDYIRLISRACEEYIAAYNEVNYPINEMTEHLCVVGRLQRLCFASPLLTQYWTSPDIDWRNILEEDFTNSARPPLLTFSDGSLRFPSDTPVAARDGNVAFPHAGIIGAWRLHAAKLFLSNSAREFSRLKQQLKDGIDQSPTPSRSCVVM